MERPVRRFLLGTAFWMTTCGGVGAQAEPPVEGVARAEAGASPGRTKPAPEPTLTRAATPAR